ncbi:hypothetical protein MtrunA17_Chr8g0344691 [Medicago truncatula]|uniref:Uncharacterized protein n=1 Tax=Medicago truncatula TaxID=3880 RepID=A0A396GH73_MEDTR|nr:hypothetical protein MtrunA17_Chr8g0344691 [Medicago truncatula]
MSPLVHKLHQISQSPESIPSPHFPNLFPLNSNSSLSLSSSPVVVNCRLTPVTTLLFQMNYQKNSAPKLVV